MNDTVSDSIQTIGGLDAFYREARKQYEFSGLLQENSAPSRDDRLVWLVGMVSRLERLKASQMKLGWLQLAIQTHNLLGGYLKEMRTLLDGGNQ